MVRMSWWQVSHIYCLHHEGVRLHACLATNLESTSSKHSSLGNRPEGKAVSRDYSPHRFV